MCIRDRGETTPVLAVIIPTESIFVTSSYVNVPAIDTLPAKVATPATVIPAFISTGYVLKVAAVPVTILSVDATPISPEPSPEKDDAVMIPVTVKLPIPPKLDAVKIPV